MAKYADMNRIGKLMLFALSVTVCQSAMAQFEAGINAGYSGQWILNTALNGNESIRPHNGYYAGLLGSYTFNNDMLVEAQINFASKGHADMSMNDGHYRRDLYYLDVPVYVGYHLTRRISLMAGAQFGYLLASKKNTEGVIEDGRDDCYPCCASIVGQFTYMFTDRLGLNADFNYALTRTFSKPYRNNDGILEEDKGHNIGFQIGICYKLEID